MYFKDRAEAGAKLAAELTHLRYENTAVLALSPGGVMVGEPIARSLHTTMSLLLTKSIELADLGGQTIGVIDQAGYFTYDQMISAGMLEEIMSEMRGTIEEQKLQKFYEMSKLLGEYGLVDRKRFYGRQVIIVNDGLKTGLALEAAVNFLKPIRTQKLIGAIPVVSVAAVDRMHILCDELHVLSVNGNYLDTNHYYEDNQIGDANAVMAAINGVIKQWS